MDEILADMKKHPEILVNHPRYYEMDPDE